VVDKPTKHLAAVPINGSTCHTCHLLFALFLIELFVNVSKSEHMDLSLSFLLNTSFFIHIYHPAHHTCPGLISGDVVSR
jgi:hypothetical protein